MLSILIPTLVDRKPFLDQLLNKLTRISQPYKHLIEIVVECDNYEKTTGDKRNILADKANGKYSCFIDDDDDVPIWYFDSIFKVLQSDSTIDCIGFKGLIITEGRKGRQMDVFRHSVGLPYSEGKVNGEYLRPPNHLNPMLTDYFRQIRFPDLTFAEDFSFCNRLAEAKLIKNEKFLDIIMYHYKYRPQK